MVLPSIFEGARVYACKKCIDGYGLTVIKLRRTKAESRRSPLGLRSKKRAIGDIPVSPLVMPPSIKDHGSVEIPGFHGFQVFGDGCLVHIAIKPPPPAVYAAADSRLFEVLSYLIKLVFRILAFVLATASQQEKAEGQNQALLQDKVLHFGLVSG